LSFEYGVSSFERKSLYPNSLNSKLETFSLDLPPKNISKELQCYLTDADISAGMGAGLCRRP
jgi:hypothetical protein